MIKKYTVNGITTQNISVEETIEVILSPIDLNKSKTIHTINADHIDKLTNLENESFNDAYQNADIVTLDSRVIQKIIRFTNHTNLKICTGSDLTQALFEKLSEHSDKSICIVGGDDDSVSHLKTRFQLINEINQYVPPMGFINHPDELRKCLTFINKQKFDLVFVAVGCPQQEILASYLKENSIFPSYYLCIGASIDFLTGVQSRAPKFIQKLNLEWAYRLIQNPKKMSKRYYSNLKILTKVNFKAE
jgi:exopolysaccharide biosynthesis WecB/TagA/CpsF family protein